MLQCKDQKMIHVLEKISLRYSALVFRKIMVYNSGSCDNDIRIRNYDLQCQSILNITAIIKTKVYAIQLKFFHQLKNYTEENNSQRAYLTPKASKISEETHNFRFTRSSKNTATLPYLHNCWHSRNENTFAKLSQRSRNPQLQQIDLSFRQLICKIRKLNDKIKNRNLNLTNRQVCGKEKTEEMRRKILLKLNQLEQEIEVDCKLSKQKQSVIKLKQNLIETILNRPKDTMQSRITNRTQEDSYVVNFDMTP